MSEEALMAAYIAGDRRAFERLFALLGPRVHAFFLRSFRSAAVADDLLQTTFLNLHRARASYQVDRPLRPWLFAIAARVRLDELRRRYRLAEEADEDALEAAERAQAQASGGDQGDEARGEIIARVREALDALPETQRVVVQLHRYEGLTFPEIAAVLRTTEGAVKLRAFRAYEQLRKQLAGSLTEEAA
jgi:RNA polymerase sigma-70 factor (ECF subfamily)